MQFVYLSLAFVLAGTTLVPAQTTIFFDGEGPEEGVTELGVTSFSYRGSNWDLKGFGGLIVLAPSAETASGLQAYELMSGDAGTNVIFDEPVDSIEFFYVHEGGLGSPGFVTVWSTNETVLGIMESRQATVAGDPTNFIFFDPPEPIGRVNFNFGILDNFTFTTIAPPPPAPVPTVSTWGMACMTLLLLSVGTVAIRRVVSVA